LLHGYTLGRGWRPGFFVDLTLNPSPKERGGEWEKENLKYFYIVYGGIKIKQVLFVFPAYRQIKIPALAGIKISLSGIYFFITSAMVLPISAGLATT
jgi:hypothetical protein